MFMKKAFIILITVIAIAEFLTMLVLGSVNKEVLGPWIPALFDASVVSLAAIITIGVLIKRSLVLVRGKGERIQFKIGSIVCVLEKPLMHLLR